MAKQRESKQEGITAISVQGFKSLAEESRIEIHPLTILAGANSSGKSSMMQPLLLMKQTLEASYDPGPLLLDGPNAKFTSVDQFISHVQKNANDQAFGVEIEHAKYTTLKVVFSFLRDQMPEITDMIYKDKKNEYSLHLRPNLSSRKIKKAFSTPKKDKIKWPKGLEFEVVRNRCFLKIIRDATSSLRDQKNILEGFATLLRDPNKFSQLFRYDLLMRSMIHSPDRYDRLIRSTIHVPGLRGNPERVYKTTATGPDFPGTFENYVASVVALWQTKNDDRLNQLAEMLVALGLTWKIATKTVDYTQIELLVGRLPQPRSTDDLVSIADVGFGVSQVLPVLVALLIAEPGRLVYLEQPELHLHPRAQYALAKILAASAKRGVKLVVETHSALLLLMVQTLVAKGNLDPELVKLHWFSRSDENGTTSIQSADLDGKGAFGDWAEDFGDIELRAEGAYLDAVEGRSK